MEVLKNPVVEVDEVVLLGVEGSCEVIFYILGIEKKRIVRRCLSDVLSR
jgi:hypothetical protein